jgi:hypothetical protein
MMGRLCEPFGRKCRVACGLDHDWELIDNFKNLFSESRF